MGIWIYGYMGIWVYGYMDIWVYGYMDNGYVFWCSMSITNATKYRYVHCAV